MPAIVCFLEIMMCSSCRLHQLRTGFGKRRQKNLPVIDPSLQFDAYGTG
jgi:hypothetical protein